MSNFIAGVIGTRGQEILAEQLVKLISKEVCEGIRKAFQGPLVDKYKELLTSAAEGMDDKFFTNKLETVMGALDIKKVTIKGGGSRSRVFGGDEEKDEEKAVVSPIAIPSELSSGLPPGLPPGLPGLSGLTDMVKSTTAGLAPDEGVVPGYLSTALTEDTVKQMLIDGMDKLVTYMTTDGKDELVKMFIGVLKEQINKNYQENEGEFQEIITKAITGKCEELKAEEEEEEDDEEDDEKDGRDNVLGGKSKKRTRTTRKIKNKSLK